MHARDPNQPAVLYACVVCIEFKIEGCVWDNGRSGLAMSKKNGEFVRDHQTRVESTNAQRGVR